MFENRQELSVIIKSTMEEHGINMLDAILHICEKFNVEEETIATYIRQSHKLKEELRAEASHLKLLKK